MRRAQDFLRPPSRFAPSLISRSMRRMTLLGFACAAWACLCSPVLRADDQPDTGKAAARAPAAKPALPNLGRAVSAPSSAPSASSAPGGEARQAAPRLDSDADAEDAGAGFGGDQPANGAKPYEVYSLYPASAADATGSNPRGAEFHSLPAWLQAHAAAIYGGAGADYVVAQYPASTDDNVAWQLFGGARTRYVGGELDFHTLGYYRAVVNNQTVRVGTDMVSLSVLGFLPLADDSDLYVRYGRTAWSVNATGAGNTPSAMTSGTDGTAAVGMEFRQGALLLRVEARRFWRVYQSDAYFSFGFSVGGYIH